jgi:hypothetical protein
MKPVESILNTDRINYLNIGLMLVSCAVAFFVPFELFLISYAFLGPLHYLTEISWLHERKYFSKGKFDFVFLGLASVALFITSYVLLPNKLVSNEMHNGLSTAFVCMAFIAAIAMVVLKTPFQRFIAVFIIMIAALVTRSGFIFFSVFLPTLVHVYLFTGLFMLYGAMKGRSRSGYFACIIFILLPLSFVFVHPAAMPITEWAKESYKQFQGVNFYMLNLWDENVYALPIKSQDTLDMMLHGVYNSTIGVAFMRFIAFAYTYHYLNWFSKTTVIKWHKIPKVRMGVILFLWIASAAFYIYDYKIGFHVLFFLSFLHVFLEFPLNHVTFMGIFTEAKAMLSGKSAQASAAVTAPGKKAKQPIKSNRS